nr:unnamed protein product [Callosobruchus analis]
MKKNLLDQHHLLNSFFQQGHIQSPFHQNVYRISELPLEVCLYSQCQAVESISFILLESKAYKHLNLRYLYYGYQNYVTNGSGPVSQYLVKSNCQVK